jgi:2'-5' RNA ligase
MDEDLLSVSDHWWWRQGWSEGKRFYTWHFTFEGQEALREMARRYQEAISRFSFYDLVPLEWLHLTTQGIGFTHLIPIERALAVAARVGERLSSQRPIKASVGSPRLFSEAIACPLTPVEPLSRVRSEIREAIAEVLGQVDEDESFHPHVSFAYSNTAAPAPPVRQALESVGGPPVELEIGHVDLIRLGRDHRIYEWELVDRVVFEAR